MPVSSLPLFPLSSVLFPGGTLSLRIFERRYLDLIRDCARDNTGFGVCLILHGSEAGEPAIPAAIGTAARITDFHTMEDGLLGIHATGGDRFHVVNTRVRDNGLIVGDVEYIASGEPVPIPPEYALLATILERVYECAGGDLARVERARFDDADWVGYRLAEALPLENDERQKLLSTTGAMQRLDQLMHYLPRFQRA